ncbi:MAG: hypothetical protein IH991_23870 [Planctomycetes bacterium]|nr:hypothetical protein [Planctomycetota bacterium]
MRRVVIILGTVLLCILAAQRTFAQIRYPLPYPPKLQGGKSVVSHRSPEFLEPGPNLRDGVQIAKTAPLVEMMYYPGQNYSGNPWCFRGVGSARDGKYYSALCDHLAPLGAAKLFEYDSATKQFRLCFAKRVWQDDSSLENDDEPRIFQDERSPHFANRFVD